MAAEEGSAAAWRGEAVAPARLLPPIRARDFWMVQALVFLIAAGHTFVEVVVPVAFPPPLYLIPTSMFFIPVVYAAVHFGARGAVTTALWSLAVTMPNIVLLHAGVERLGILWQFGVLLLIAAFVGVRVDRERLARAEVEARERALAASQLRYRALFDSAADAVLVLDADGRVEAANAASAWLTGGDVLPVGMQIERLLGAEIAAAVASGTVPDHPLRFTSGVPEQPRWLEVLASGQVVDDEGRRRVQVILHDVTAQEERRQDLERFARRTVTAREEERRRIGRELHDGPLQSLVLVGRTLDGIVDAPTPAASASAVGEARDVVDSAAGELRRLSRALRPSILDDLGLVPAIRSEAAALARRTGIDARLSVAGGYRAASAETELMLLRVTQEALHNIERHADAGQAGVRLSFGAHCVRLVIRDDGRGPGTLPSAASLLGAGRLGVVGMEERARLAGGQFCLRPRRSGGTVVSVQVPYEVPVSAAT
jgi:signal transduction histidine kinase